LLTREPMNRALALSLFAPVLVLAVACGSTASGTGTGTGTDGGSTDSAVEGSTTDGSTQDGATDGGTDLFPSDTTKIVVTDKGGFGLPAPDGSTCSISDRTFTLLLPARELSWKLCELTDAGNYEFRTGQVTLSAADFVPLSDALHGLRRATMTGCGADKPVETIVFTTPAGDTTYEDSFYFCNASDPKAYVTGLDAVLSELDKLAK
jgi:hypothetical protein